MRPATSPVELTREYPRSFVPSTASMGCWEDIETIGRALLARTPDTSQALQRWLEDVSELTACVSEERARRVIAMTSRVDDSERERDYTTFIHEIEPRWKQLRFTLDVAFLQNPHRHALPAVCQVLDRRVENRTGLFHEENLPLLRREAELTQEYVRLTTASRVLFRGSEYTLQQMGSFLADQDRATRKEAWEQIARHRLLVQDQMDELYDRLLRVRERIATNAGVESFGLYKFRVYNRFDYTPQDCERLHDRIEAQVVPLAQSVARRRQRQLQVDRLRPWDLEVDPLGGPPLKPFKTVDELIGKSEQAFSQVAPEFGRMFRFMRERGLLDLEHRKGKAPGGYQQDLDERRWPFIFMHATGLDSDVRTLHHEAGHAFHLLASRDIPLLELRTPPTEFSELVAMAMELLTVPYLEWFYPRPADRRRAYRERLERTVTLIPWVATIDAFSQWVYTHPGHTLQARRSAWRHNYARFQPSVDWSGYEDVLNCWWHGERHIFLFPFYYIAYAIAAIGALSVWQRARTDYRDAVEMYRRALGQGGQLPLGELFAETGAQFDLEVPSLAPLTSFLTDELELAVAADSR